ncbi:hypothetical protein RJT34_00415 [Clitoria ternatea]|uniref:FBD domain-containing protein n=1 Tax=Clitoria ternatea TaxID=43366 RepID=A0AAN9KF82_CLITE
MVKVLTVCSYVLQVLPTGPKLRMERNMCTKHLTMKLDLHEYELCGISFLLKSCPMLECLTLQLGLGRNLPDDEEVIKSNDDERIWFNNLPAHECLRSTLRFVEVKNFVGTGKELNFLYYLIRCGKVLENINVYVKKGEAIDNEDMAFYCKKEKFLMMTDRASDRLQISFYY